VQQEGVEAEVEPSQILQTTAPSFAAPWWHTLHTTRRRQQQAGGAEDAARNTSVVAGVRRNGHGRSAVYGARMKRIWMLAVVVSGAVQASPLSEHAAARAALVAHDGLAALQALTAEPVAVEVVPGLYGRAARLRGDEAEACRAAAVTAEGAAHVVARARCARDTVAALAAAPSLAVAMLVVNDDALMTVLEASRSPAVTTVLAPAIELPVAAFGAEARARMARLFVLLQRAGGATAERAQQRLLDELPEQPAALEVLAAVGDAGMSPTARVRRATTLERLQKNAAVVELVGDLVDTSCEAALLVGKAERKLRHYQASRRALQQATAQRCGEVAKKAQYLEAKVATIQKGASAEKVARAFVARWTTDPLVDDVLLWLAEVLHARGNSAEEQAVLRQIIGDHVDGDMVDEARFRLAMLLAAEHNTVAARAVLADASESLLRRNGPPVERDRARYWHARLAFAPELTSWTPGSDQREGRALLSALATERPASFYGRMASLVAGVASVPLPRRSIVDVTAPAALQADVLWKQALLAAMQGYDDEAATLLAGVGTGRGDVEAAMAIAAVFAQVGRPDLAHRSLRDRGFAQLTGAPTTTAAAQQWSLAWPRAWANELTAAAIAFKVPPPLLMGLAREESAFDADVVSWAGAAGLCQLMPPTAADEARSMRRAPPTAQELVDPAFNARLGASHLGRRLHGMRHPFMAIAAYNAGPGSVAKWMPPAGESWPVDVWVERIPVDETRNYVKKVTGSWVTYALLDGGDVSFGLTIAGR
jgi:soluble lytic murein transglycosylase